MRNFSAGISKSGFNLMAACMEHLTGRYFLNTVRSEAIREQIGKICGVKYEKIFLHADTGLKRACSSNGRSDASQTAVDKQIQCSANSAIGGKDSFSFGNTGNSICDSCPERAAAVIIYQKLAFIQE